MVSSAPERKCQLSHKGPHPAAFVPRKIQCGQTRLSGVTECLKRDWQTIANGNHSKATGGEEEGNTPPSLLLLLSLSWVCRRVHSATFPVGAGERCRVPPRARHPNMPSLI